MDFIELTGFSLLSVDFWEPRNRSGQLVRGPLYQLCYESKLPLNAERLKSVRTLLDLCPVLSVHTENS